MTAVVLTLTSISLSPTASAADRSKVGTSAKVGAPANDRTTRSANSLPSVSSAQTVEQHGDLFGPTSATLVLEMSAGLTPSDWDDPSAKHWKEGSQGVQDMIRPARQPHVPHAHPASMGAGLGPMLQVPPRAVEMSPPPGPRKMQR